MSNKDSSSVELVITAPEPFSSLVAYHARCRTTMGVLTEVILEAQRRLVIGAPFIQKSHGLSSEALSIALRTALGRGVNVDILSTTHSLLSIDQEYFAKDSIGHLRFFVASSNLADSQKLGSHAKFCIADGILAYIGSANLTFSGLSDQIEMGVLIRGTVAQQIDQFWDYAIQAGLLVLTSNHVWGN